MENWVVLRKGADFQRISETFHISPRLAALIRNRDIITDEEIRSYLYGTIADLHDGMLMKDMDKAVTILAEKIGQGESIRIIGDYDIDGVNATYILLKGLEGLGARVDSDIPDRIKDGYGLNQQLIDRALDDDIDTIVTCDNGIAASEEIAYAKSFGMSVIVTDHHEVPYEEEGNQKVYRLPPADAVVDPKQTDCAYPFPDLCGAAVAYKLIEALYQAMGQDAEDVDYLMEQVAIATVGDVMDLRGENRIFVKQGLEMMRRTVNPGLKALMECTHIEPRDLSAYHIGFVLGPCLNAGGRLDTAKRALALLCAPNEREAAMLAGDLKALNDSRKEMTEKAVEEAILQVEERSLGEDLILVIYLPECHESLAGIVAGRIRERYHKPAFVLTRTESGVKGSGRSIETYHMYEALHRCQSLLIRFGGHKLAAGLSLTEENVVPFRQMINEQNTLPAEAFIRKISIDMQLPFGAVNEGFIAELKQLEPFGKGNTKPVFAEREVTICRVQLLGKKQNVLKFRFRDQTGSEIDGIYFGQPDIFFTYIQNKYQDVTKEAILSGRCPQMTLAVAYYPSVNEYMGTKTLQIVVQNFR